MGWLVDLLLCRPPQPRPKTEQQLAFELVLRLLQSEQADWPVTSSHYIHHAEFNRTCIQQVIYNRKAQTAVTCVLYGSAKYAIEARVKVGGEDLKMSGRQRVKIERALNSRGAAARTRKGAELTRNQLKLLVEAAEEIL